MLPEQSTSQKETGKLDISNLSSGLVIRGTQGRQLWGAGKFKACGGPSLKWVWFPGSTECKYCGQPEGVWLKPSSKNGCRELSNEGHL